MYYEEYQPYYKTASDPELYAMEAMQEQEWDQMTDYYSITVRQILRAVRAQCQRLDFDGSFIYDERPDSDALRTIVSGICAEIRPRITENNGGVIIQSRSNDFLEDLVQVLLLQEIARRRCRNQRCNHHMNKRR